LLMRKIRFIDVSTVKRNIHKKEFKILAEVCDIPANAAEKMIEKLCVLENKMLSLVDESYLPQAQRDELKTLIRDRVAILL